MNLIQVSESQIMFIWFSCLAMLNSPLPQEEKIQILENALMAKMLDSQQALPVVVSGLIPFDQALQDYANAIETRMKNFDLSQVSTGSEPFDIAFKARLQKIIDTNFITFESVEP